MVSPSPTPPATTTSTTLRPPLSRTRASSTSLRPPLSLATLSPRSRASSISVPQLPSCSSSANSSCAASTSSSPSEEPVELALPIPLLASDKRSGLHHFAMFPALVSRTVELARALRPGATGKHSTTALFASPISSPRSSTDTDYILPMSASPRKTSFDSDELTPPPHLRVYFRIPTFPSAHAPLLLVLVLFPLSTALTLFCLSTLPISFAWPRTLSDLAQLGRDLNTYSQSGFLPTTHVLAVLSVSAVWKHAWSIPGSVLWNVLAGALFHPLLATLVMTVLTTLGSIFSTLLATPLAPILTRLFPRPIELTRSVLEGSSSSTSSSPSSEEPKFFQPSNLAATSSSPKSSSGTPAWVRLSVLRLIGLVPWSALNIACGLTGVALRDCATGAFIGTLPWTAVTCQIGNILHTVGVVSSTEGMGSGIAKTATLSSVLASPQIMLELVFLSILSLAPILGRDRLRKLITPSEPVEAVVELETMEDEVFDEKEAAEYAKYGRRGRGTRRQRWTWQKLSLSVPRWSAVHPNSRETLLAENRDLTR